SGCSPPPPAATSPRGDARRPRSPATPGSPSAPPATSTGSTPAPPTPRRQPPARLRPSRPGSSAVPPSEQSLSPLIEEPAPSPEEPAAPAAPADLGRRTARGAGVTL